MEAESWSRSPASSRRHQRALQSRFASDVYMGFEEVDGGEDDPYAEFPCPFCGEEFDVVGLCCHIDEEHPAEAQNGVCPVCEVRIGMDMVRHITLQHGNFFKNQHRRRFPKGASGFHCTLSLLKKELREGHIKSHHGGSSYVLPNAAPDPLLSSFICSLHISDPVKDVQPRILDEESAVIKRWGTNVVESVEPTLSNKELEEMSWRSEFVQELVLSTMFEHTL